MHNWITTEIINKQSTDVGQVVIILQPHIVQFDNLIKWSLDEVLNCCRFSALT